MSSACCPCSCTGVLFQSADQREPARHQELFRFGEGKLEGTRSCLDLGREAGGHQELLGFGFPALLTPQYMGTQH